MKRHRSSAEFHHSKFSSSATQVFRRKQPTQYETEPLTSAWLLKAIEWTTYRNGGSFPFLHQLTIFIFGDDIGEVLIREDIALNAGGVPVDVVRA